MTQTLWVQWNFIPTEICVVEMDKIFKAYRGANDRGF